jgi:hypothetical protein
MRLLDADVLIDVLRGVPAAVGWLESVDEAAGVPGFVALELIQGCRNKKEVSDVEGLLAPFDIHWPAPADCEAIRLKFANLYLRSGVGVLDALTAACAIGLSATLCTFNARHYRDIDGLRMESPYKRR